MKHIPFHPILLSFSLGLSLYVSYTLYYPFSRALPILLGIAGLAGVLLAGLAWAMKDMQKAAGLTSLLSVFFLSYGPFTASMYLLSFKKEWIGQLITLLERESGNLILLLGWCVFFAIVIGLLLKARFQSTALTLPFNLFAILLILSVGVQWLSASQSSTDACRQSPEQAGCKPYAPDDGQDPPLHPDAIQGSRPFPDIYYIILDGMAGPGILQSLYGYDASRLTTYLQSHGFYVAGASRSNYNMTQLSISSSLNLTYLNRLNLSPVGGPYDPGLINSLVRNNAVFQELGELGYKTVEFTSTSSLRDTLHADLILSPPEKRDEFQITVLKASPFSLLAHHWLYDDHRAQILYTLDHISDVAEWDGDYIVYAHVFAPHPPFVLDRDGAPKYPGLTFSLMDADVLIDRIGPEQYRSGYRDQAAYLATRLPDVIDAILAHSKTPPIIILQGDHGPRSRLDNFRLENTDLEESFSIFNAYYFPDGDYSSLYASISPVNSFRVVMNQYFGGSFDLLPDRQYLSGFRNKGLPLDITAGFPP